ncbi:MAG: hypothetical protein KDA78_05710 [Planctomycetaceae bacterium]|nr:hypothetical protein [Planctomycetaceae bacterium]
MNATMQQFYLTVANALGTSPDLVEQWTWGGLVLSFMFATVHLVTMLVTRWGDHHASSKSLLFSVMIHLCSGAGVIVLAPEPVKEKVVRDLEPIQIQEVIMPGVRQTRTDLAGNTPIWESVPLTQTEQVHRMEREQFNMTTSSLPERDPSEPVELTPDLPEMAKTQSSNQEQPEIAMNAPAPMERERAAIPQIESPETPPLPKPAPQGTDNVEPTRSMLPRSIADAEDVQRPNQGGADKISTTFVDQKQLKSPESERGPQPEIPNKGEIAEMIERRPAPEEATPDLQVTGEMTPNPEGPSQASPTENRMITRSDRNGENRPNDTPQLARTVGPLPDATIDPTFMPAQPLAIARDEIPQLSNLPQPNFDAVRRDQSAEIPATYRLRDLERRRDIARRFGGTDASEEAVERALSWLAASQEEAGFWDASKHGAGQVEIDETGVNRQRAGIQSDTGLTALTILAFLGAGYTQEEGKYAATVGKAINWLIDQQRDDGYLGGEATRYAGMYCHAMTTYALAESYGMQSERKASDRLATAVGKGVQFTVAMQNKDDGGWRYLPGWSGDMSMFGWQMMALKSAEIAGVSVPEESRTLMVKFLQDRSLGDRKGLAAYHPDYGAEVTPSMTAEALFCKQILGLQRGNPASKEAVAYLLDQKNFPRLSDPNMYYWYYGTLAMYQHGGPEWEQWNAQVRELLVGKQRKNGELAGTWDPDGPWGGFGGRLYSTTLATLSLEVYYRFLPLYRINE